MASVRVDIISIGTLSRNRLWNETAAVRTPHATTSLIRVGKRHILVDTGGLVLRAKVHNADIQDRAGVPLLLDGADDQFPSLKHLWVDQGYTGSGRHWIEAQLRRWPSDLLAKAIARLAEAERQVKSSGGVGPIAADVELFAVCRQAARLR